MALPRESTTIFVTSLPSGMPKVTDFSFITRQLLPSDSNNSLPANHVLFESQYSSVDPYMRGRLAQWLNKPLPTAQILKIIAISPQMPSQPQTTSFDTGDLFMGVLPCSDYHLLDVTTKKYRKLGLQPLPRISAQISPSMYLGLLGTTGATAWQGLFDLKIGQLKKNENILISGAAGAVGSAVGQIAKQVLNCHVVGIAGTQAKIDYLVNELQFDSAICYRDPVFSVSGSNFSGKNSGKQGGNSGLSLRNSLETRLNNDRLRIRAMQKILKEKFPNGIDFYFDNVGGWITSAVWDLLNKNARVAICGQIYLYNKLGKYGALLENVENDVNQRPYIDDFLYKTIYSNVGMEGFVLFDFKKWNLFYKDMIQWISDGKIKNKEHLYYGLENVPNAFLGLFKGENTGKMVIDMRNSKNSNNNSNNVVSSKL